MSDTPDADAARARKVICVSCAQGFGRAPTDEHDDRDPGHDQGGFWLPCKAINEPQTTERIAAGLRDARVDGAKGEREAYATLRLLAKRLAITAESIDRATIHESQHEAECSYDAGVGDAENCECPNVALLGTLWSEGRELNRELDAIRARGQQEGADG